MKYIFYSDIHKIFKKNYKMMLIYFALIILIFISKILAFQKITILDYHLVLGLSFVNNARQLDKVMYIFNIMICVYVVLNLYVNCFKSNLENLFLRMDLTLWSLLKSLSLYLIIIIIKLTVHLGILIFFKIKNIVITDFLVNLFTDISMVCLFTIITILIYSFFHKNKKLFLTFILMILLIIVFFQVPITVLLLRKYILSLLYILIALTCIYAITIKKLYLGLFERGE